MESVEARVAALEQLVATLQKSNQKPLVDLIDWAAKESVNELGRTRGTLLALQAFALAAIATAADRPALAVALESALQRADADLVLLRLPDRALPAAQDGLNETAAALRRALCDGRGAASGG